MYVSNRILSSGGAGRSAAVCGSGTMQTGLREGLVLCGGPLLLSLFPFLVVSSLLMQCPASDLLAVPFRPLARGIGVHSPCAARVLMIGFFGGFAPAANAAAQAVRTGQLTAREADACCRVCLLRAVLCGADGGGEYAGQR